jgi:hypothetical protein
MVGWLVGWLVSQSVSQSVISFSIVVFANITTLLPLLGDIRDVGILTSLTLWNSLPRHIAAHLAF